MSAATRKATWTSGAAAGAMLELQVADVGVTTRRRRPADASSIGN
jgi:hypothetical protein